MLLTMLSAIWRPFCSAGNTLNVRVTSHKQHGVSNHRQSIAYSTVCSDVHQRKRKSSALLPFVRGIHRSNHRQSIAYSIVCSDVHQRKHKSSALLNLWEGNPPVTGELVTGGFTSQRASNAKNVAMSWRHHISRSYSRRTTPIDTCRTPQARRRRFSAARRHVWA